MYKTIFVGLTIGILAAALLVANTEVIYGQGSGMQIFVSPQDRDEDDSPKDKVREIIDNRDEDDSKDKVREIIDKVKDSDSNEEEEDARDTIEKFKDRDDSRGDGDSGGGVGWEPDECNPVRTTQCGDASCLGRMCLGLFD